MPVPPPEFCKNNIPVELLLIVPVPLMPTVEPELSIMIIPPKLSIVL